MRRFWPFSYRIDFLRKNQIPNEEEQFLEYSKIVSAAQGRFVTIRTLDIGGDKNLNGIPVKMSRILLWDFGQFVTVYEIQSLSRPIKSNSESKCIRSGRLMFPMISGVGELIRAKELLFTAKSELKERGLDFDKDISVGCMIETPSAVLIADMLAEEADFSALEPMILFNIYWQLIE